MQRKARKGGSDGKGHRPEYKRSDFGKLERGKYYKRVKAGSSVVVLDDENAAVFPNSAAVNRALRSLVDVAQRASGAKRRPTGRIKTTRR